jgi:hypothetical protein
MTTTPPEIEGWWHCNNNSKAIPHLKTLILPVFPPTLKENNYNVHLFNIS